MALVTHIVDERAIEFMRSFSSVRESTVAAKLREATASHPRRNMQIGMEQGCLMALLATMIGAKRCLEVGVFTGYSALCVAERLPPDGRLVACDISEEYTSVGKPFWEEAGVADRIELRLGPASDTLSALIDEGQSGSFDFAFIDADKTGYDDYYEKCLRLVRNGGIVLLDNMFLRGATLDPRREDEPTVTVRALLSKISRDERVDASVASVGDGIAIVRKREEPIGSFPFPADR